MFIFDDPLKHVNDYTEAAILFKNMSDYLIQTGKTILVATNNEEVSRAMRLPMTIHFHALKLRGGRR